MAPVTRKERSGERGHFLIETALIYMPMLAMFFGVIDVSMIIFLQSTFTSSTRLAARFAITYSSSYGSMSCTASQAACITQVTEDNAVGFLSGSKSSYITVNYYTANDLTNPAESCNQGTCVVNPNGVSTASMPQTLANGIVVNYVNQPGNVIQVEVVNYPWNWLLPISAKGYALTNAVTNLTASSMDVLGGLQPGQTGPPNP